MKVYWLEQTEAGVPTGDEWLAPAECLCLQSMRIPKRRADWRLGRWTAKCALAHYLKVGSSPHDLQNIVIRPRPCGAPDALLGDAPAPLTLSLSHRDGTAACAVTVPRAALGCDIEKMEARSDAFIADFFSAEERRFLAQASAAQRSRLAMLLWSAKESALKALRVGLRLDTRSVTVTLIDSFLHRPAPWAWHRLHVCLAGGQNAAGWWQDEGRLVRTVVAAPASLAPFMVQSTAGSRTEGQVVNC